MKLSDRIQEAEQQFKTKELERNQHLDAAEACLEEMHRLQGEWRILNQLINDEPKPADKATTITAEEKK